MKRLIVNLNCLWNQLRGHGRVVDIRVITWLLNNKTNEIEEL